ncbi:hypothetical protein MIND_00998600 [Mycena indigotica]|uniref:Uncharacterized protein n=1 Tax=Mycena indigotica TaxID=2126181 RepID=A0A8H6S7T6_9AGAR|nr:uncharacterized protein MIND_00998600 [Mycena indigotica]KAF7294620.1 hypothetical protein MIND_00998600 [Mycena indigotica]
MATQFPFTHSVSALPGAETLTIVPPGPACPPNANTLNFNVIGSCDKFFIDDTHTVIFLSIAPRIILVFEIELVDGLWAINSARPLDVALFVRGRNTMPSSTPHWQKYPQRAQNIHLVSALTPQVITSIKTILGGPPSPNSPETRGIRFTGEPKGIPSVILLDMDTWEMVPARYSRLGSWDRDGGGLVESKTIQGGPQIETRMYFH